LVAVTLNKKYQLIAFFCLYRESNEVGNQARDLQMNTVWNRRFSGPRYAERAGQGENVKQLKKNTWNGLDPDG